MIGLVMPGMSVVSFLFSIPTAEQTRFGIEVEFLHKNVGSVGVVDQVFEVVIVGVLARTGVLCQARLNQVIDDVLVQTTIERDIRATADGAIDVCLLCSTGIRGSTTIYFAPLSWALCSHLALTGWFSTELDPMFIMTSVFCMSHQ